MSQEGFQNQFSGSEESRENSNVFNPAWRVKKIEQLHFVREATY